MTRMGVKKKKKRRKNGSSRIAKDRLAILRPHSLPMTQSRAPALDPVQGRHATLAGKKSGMDMCSPVLGRPDFCSWRPEEMAGLRLRAGGGEGSDQRRGFRSAS
jgi:hypothetical protein